MLGIAVEKVSEVIAKAKALEVHLEMAEPDAVADAAEGPVHEVLEDYADDMTRQELRDTIDGFSEEEQVNLVALTWLGRGTYTADDWPATLAEAQRAHNDHTGDYLASIPLLASHLEEGLSQLGYSSAE